MDDGVAAGEDGLVDLVEAKAVGAHIAADGHHAASDHCLERFAAGVEHRVGQLRLQPVEGVVLEDLAAHSLGGIVALAGAYEQHQRAAGCTAQQALDERGAHEPGAAGDGDSLVRELFGNHADPFSGLLSTIW